MAQPRRYGLLVAAVLAVAVAVRSVPLLHSPLPTPHAFAYIPPTIQTIETEGLVVAGRTDYIFWHTWLAELSVLFDVHPLYLVRPISALVGGLPAILAVAVTRRLCAHWGWPARRTWAAAGLAGLFIGIQGLYLYRSMAPHPNTIGLFVLPLFVVTLYRAYVSGRRGWWGATAGLLAIVPPLHVFVSLVIAIIVTILAGLVVARERGLRQPLPLIGVAGLLWLYVPGFHFLLRHVTPTEVAYTERVTEVPGLFLAWIVLGVLGAIWLVGTSPRTQRRLGWGVFGGLFALLALNAVVPVFHAAPPTPPFMLAAFGPLVVLVMLAMWRLPELTGATRVGPPLVAIVAGTLVVIAVTLTAVPTVVHLTTAERANYFFHFPVMVLAGMGGAALLGRVRRPRPQLVRSGLTVALVVCAAASIPVAFAGVPVLPYENSTDGAELAATQFAMERVEGQWTSDGHLRDIATRIGPGETPAAYALVGVPANITVEPTYNWLSGVADRPPDCATMLKRSWTTDGAHFFPRAPERLGTGAYREHLDGANVVYATGATDDLHLALSRTGSGAC